VKFMNKGDIKQRLQALEELVREMANVLDEGPEDAPLAFFEACEDALLQITQLMRATFLAVQMKP
jgi:hypothetical protein